MCDFCAARNKIRHTLAKAGADPDEVHEFIRAIGDYNELDSTTFEAMMAPYQGPHAYALFKATMARLNEPLTSKGPTCLNK